MLTLALLCGAGSVLVLRGIVADQEEARAAREVVKPVAARTVVVAREPLAFGTVLTEQNLTTVPWPGDAVPDGAFETVASVVGGEPRTALFPVEPNEMLLAGKVTGPGERAGLSRLVDPGRRAVTLRVNDVAGVAGFVLPGDMVDVLMTNTTGDQTTNDVILQGVKVLSIDQLADQKASTPTVVKAVTVEVDPESAQKIVLAQAVGSLSLALRRSGDREPVAVDTVTVSDVLGGGTPAPVVAATAAAPVPTPDRDATIGVTRALQRTEYKVPVRRQAAVAPVSAEPDRLATLAADDPGAVR